MERVGRYRITGRLGEGGMGVVYAARDDRLDRPVAIKMIRDSAPTEAARERFWREARAAASVNHPNICQLYEIGEENGELFLAMELLEGESLAGRVERGSLPLTEATQIALSVLAALAVLHQRGIVHRDLKSSNVFLTSHGVKLLDFGLARVADPGLEETLTNVTMQGVLMGTPRYMAPEQLRGQPVDARSDLYALGVLLYEMVTGQVPFRGDTAAQVFHSVLYEPLPVLTGSAAIAAIDRVIHRAMARQPHDRYATAELAAEDLRAALSLRDSGEMPQVRSMTRLIVLPFRALRPDPDTDFLAFSLADAIAGSLSGLESLIVRSSLAAARLAGDTVDLQRVAAEAEVDVVLTGTLLRAGEQLRVSTQLVEAPKGTLIWSQTTQVPLGDIFQLQDSLTQRIVESLSLPLTTREHRLLKADVPASAKAYEFYLRACQLSHDPGTASLARDLFRQCLDEDQTYAPAWARLGRIYRVMAKWSKDDASANVAQAEKAFKRALELNPDLAIAHNLYAQLEVDLGRAPDAMRRLLERAGDRRTDPELFAGLCAPCRYCGLLEASVAAAEKAKSLDPKIPTSVAHTHFLLGAYERVIEGGLDQIPLIGVQSLVALGRESEARSAIDRLTEKAVPRMRDLLAAARALLDGRPAESVLALDRVVGDFKDPEGLFYFGRHYARLGEARRALETLASAVDGGFFCYPVFLRDSWLDPVRNEAEFERIVARAEAGYRRAVAGFRQADGARVLGIAPPPAA